MALTCVYKRRRNGGDECGKCVQTAMLKRLDIRMHDIESTNIAEGTIIGAINNNTFGESAYLFLIMDEIDNPNPSGLVQRGGQICPP